MAPRLNRVKTAEGDEAVKRSDGLPQNRFNQSWTQNQTLLAVV